MTAVFAITFPIYALMGLGYGATRFGLFSVEDMRAFGRYVINIALPALAFSVIATRPAETVFQIDYLLIFAGAGVLNIAVAYALFYVQGLDPMRRALSAMGATCPNSGFIGYPILLLALPEVAALVLAMNFMVELLLLQPICLLLIENAANQGTASVGKQLRQSALRVIKMPMISAILCGILISAFGLPIPAAIVTVTEILAQTAGAIALLVIGSALVGLPLHGNRVMAIQVSLIKLILHPTLCVILLWLLTTAGWIALTPEMQTAVILSCAMPMFALYTIWAQQRGHEGAASLAMLGATTGAFVTLNILLWILI